MNEGGYSSFMAGSLTNTVESLYIHVPFCAQKCAYCAFYSEPSCGELVNRYVAALIRELELVADDLKPQTIFFGGGTPSLLNLRQWEQILRAHGTVEFARRGGIHRGMQSRHRFAPTRQNCSATSV